jgi:hypothetical protein
MPGSYFEMMMERVPNDSISFFTASSMPLMIEAIAITVHTPMMTPTTVSTERSLFARRCPAPSSGSRKCRCVILTS